MYEATQYTDQCFKVKKKMKNFYRAPDDKMQNVMTFCQTLSSEYLYDSNQYPEQRIWRKNDGFGMPSLPLTDEPM